MAITREEVYEVLAQQSEETLANVYRQVYDNFDCWDKPDDLIIFDMEELDAALEDYTPTDILSGMVDPEFSVDDRWFYIEDGQLHSTDHYRPLPEDLEELADWIVGDIEDFGEDSVGEKILKDLEKI